MTTDVEIFYDCMDFLGHDNNFLKYRNFEECACYLHFWNLPPNIPHPVSDSDWLWVQMNFVDMVFPDLFSAILRSPIEINSFCPPIRRDSWLPSSAHYAFRVPLKILISSRKFPVVTLQDKQFLARKLLPSAEILMIMKVLVRLRNPQPPRKRRKIP